MIPAPGPGAAGDHGAARPVDGDVVRDTVAADRAAGRRSSCSCCASARSIGVSTPLEGQGTVREQKGDLHRAQHTGDHSATSLSAVSLYMHGGGRWL